VTASLGKSRKIEIRLEIFPFVPFLFQVALLVFPRTIYELALASYTLRKKTNRHDTLIRKIPHKHFECIHRSGQKNAVVNGTSI